MAADELASQPASLLCVLGECRLLCPSDPSRSDPTPWHRLHVRRLLQLLASAYEQAEQRDLVLKELWPIAPQDHADNRLHHTLHLIRKAWRVLHDSSRPSIELDGPMVVLKMPAGTCTDVNLIHQLQTKREPVDVARLNQLKKLLTLYRGDLAADWDNSHTISARRNQLGALYEQAVAECVNLSLDLDDEETAIYCSELLVQRRSEDVDTLCAHLALLSDAGHTSTALSIVHASIRSAWFQDHHSKDRLAELSRIIQGRLVRESHTISPAPRDKQSFQVTLTGQTRKRAAGPQMEEAPQTGLVPTTVWLDMTLKALRNDFSPITCLIGPPGAGKTTLARCVVDQLHSAFSDGVIWLHLPRPSCVVEALANELGQRFGPVAPSIEAVSTCLRSTELLVVLDAQGEWDSAQELLNRLARENPENRWLVTSWSPLNVLGERRVLLDPAELLIPQGDAGSPAMRMLKRWLDLIKSKSSDASLSAKLEQIANSVGGLPSQLQLAAQRLSTESVDTVRQGLALDPAYLLRPAIGAFPHNRGTEDSAIQRQLSWLSRLSGSNRAALRFLSAFKAWLTRGDLRRLLEHHHRPDVDTLISWCLDRNYLTRRISHDGTQGYSEYRVPPLVRSLLALDGPGASDEEVAERLCAWLAPFEAQEYDSKTERNIREVWPAPLGGDWGSVSWLDHRISDLNRLMTHWRHTQGWHAMVRLCLGYRSQLIESTHPQVWLFWLNVLEHALPRLAPADAADLLALRFATKLKLGLIVPAMTDARRCVSLALEAGQDGLQGMGPFMVKQYLARYQTPKAFMPSDSFDIWDEVHSSLAKAREAADRAQYPHALHHSMQALEQSALRNLAEVESYCLHWISNISYCMGDLERAQVLLKRARDAQMELNGLNMSLAHGVLPALIAIGQGKPTEAIERLSPMMNSTGHTTTLPKLRIDLQHVLACGHYAAGNFSVAASLSGDITTVQPETARIETLASAWLLTALTEAQPRHPGHRQTTFNSQRALKECWIQLQAEPFIYDLQGWLVHVLELFVMTENTVGALAACHALEAALVGERLTLRPGLRSQLQQMLLVCQHTNSQSLEVAVNTLLSTGPSAAPAQAPPALIRNCQLISSVIARGLHEGDLAPEK